jgi:hypothetical protein
MGTSRFIAHDDSAPNRRERSNFCWNRFWPWLASQFGLTASAPPADDEGNYTTIDMQQDCEVGYPYRATIKYQFLLSEHLPDALK